MRKAEVVESMQEVRDVVFLTNPRPRFVSLVKRGANQQPWTVVKSEKEGREDGMRKVLQAVVVPKDTPVEVIKEVLGEDVRVDKKRSAGQYDSYEQVAREVCKKDSFELVVLDVERQVRGIAGEVEEKDDSFVMKLFRPTQKVKAIELKDVQGVSAEEVQKGFSSDIYDELWKMESAISGILGQEKGEAGAKLEAIKMVMDNFFMFLSEAFSVAKFDVNGIPEMPGIEERLVEEVRKGGKALGKKRTEEIKSALSRIQELLAEVEEVSGEVAKEGEEDDMKAEDVQKMIDEAIGPVKEQVSGLVSKVEEASASVGTVAKSVEEAVAAVTKLAENVEKMQKTVPGTVVLKEDDDIKTASGDVEKTDVFAGSLFRRQ